MDDVQLRDYRGNPINPTGGMGNVPISTEETASQDDEQVWQSNDFTETYAKITPNGIYGKQLYVGFGAGAKTVQQLINASGGGGGGGASLNATTWRQMTFEPSFLACKRGRLINEHGEGTAWYNRCVIMHISDVHVYTTQLQEVLALAQTRCHAICNTGDDAQGTPGEGLAQSIIDEMTSVVNTVSASNTRHIPYLFTLGNHDVPKVSKQTIFGLEGALMQAQTPNLVFGDAAHYKLYGYYDVTPNATIGTIRIITLDMFDYPDSAYGVTRAWQTCTFSQEQIDWFIATLEDARTRGYAVMTMGHYSFGDAPYYSEEKARPDAIFYQGAFMIPDIIDAFQHGTALSHTYTDTQNIDNITVNISASENKLHYICHLFGHIHSKNEYRCQKTDGSKVYDILMLGESALCQSGVGLNKVFREPNTVNSIECSVLEIDTVQKCIYRVSYGAFLKYDASNNECNRVTKLNYNYE